MSDFCNQGYHWIELNEYINSLLLKPKVYELTNFGARPKVFSISNGEVLKQFPLIDETISHGEASQDVHHFISAAARKLASDTWDRLGARSEDEAYSCHVQRFRRDVGIAVAREFARYRLLRVPFVGVPRAVIRDRHAGRREARAVPAQGPMQADFFRHQAGIWQAR